MRLWIDGTRPPIREFHDWTPSADEAIAVLQSGKVSHVSIAWELQGEATGLAVLRWMADTGTWPRFGVHIHGGTRDQRDAMEGLVWDRYRRLF